MLFDATLRALVFTLVVAAYAQHRNELTRCHDSQSQRINAAEFLKPLAIFRRGSNVLQDKEKEIVESGCGTVSIIMDFFKRNFVCARLNFEYVI